MSPKGIDTGKQGRAVLVAQSWKINSKIFKSGKKNAQGVKKSNYYLVSVQYQKNNRTKRVS